MRALLLAALLSRQASAAKPVEAPRAPTLDMPALPAAAIPPAEAANPATMPAGPAAPQPEAPAEGPGAESLRFFDGVSLESWERLERTLLDAAGLDVPSRATHWREGVAHSLRERPTWDHFWVLERNLAAAHALDIDDGRKLYALLREHNEVNFHRFSRVFSLDGRLFALRENSDDIHERVAGDWKIVHSDDLPDLPWPSAPATPDDFPKGARLAPSGGGEIGFRGKTVYLRHGASWIQRTLATEASDAAVHRGLVYVATGMGLLPLVPKVADWGSAMRRALAQVAPMAAAESTPGHGDAWRALEAAAKESLGLAAAGFAPAWRAAAAAELRQAPDAPLTRALGLALASTLGLDRPAAERVAAIFEGDPLLRGSEAALFQDGEDLYASADSELYRWEAGAWKRVLSAAGVGRVEKREGGLLVASHGRGFEHWRNGKPTLLLNGSVHDFVALGPTDQFLVATDNSLWEREGFFQHPVALSGHKVFKLIARGDAIYALTSKGFFEVQRLDFSTRPLFEGVPVRDALFEGGAWLLAADRGLYELEGGATRWVPESLGLKFIALRRTRDGVLALSEDGLALIRQAGRWRRAPESVQGARDFVERPSLSYAVDARGVRAVADLPPRWQETVLRDLAPLVEGLSEDAAREAAGSKAGPALRDARGRSLLGP